MLWNKDIGNVSILSLDNGCCILRIEFRVYKNLMKLIHLNVEGSLLDVGERPSLLNYNPVNDFEAMAIESHFLSFARTDKEEQEIANKEAENKRGKAVEEVFQREIEEEDYLIELAEGIIAWAEPIAKAKGLITHDVITDALKIGLEQLDKEVENG